MTRRTNNVDNFHKPKLVFFPYEYDERLTPFLLIHKREHVKCLSAFFDVTVIDSDGDYQQICDKYRPDLALFESGVPFASCRRLKIVNLRACPQVPKLGFLHADAFSEGRAGFLSDMDHWGVDTFFSIATAAAEYTPEIADNLFIWPNFVDTDIHHDYQQPKSIPVLFTGSTDALYPWRQNIRRLVSKHYPSLICPHPGYGPSKAAIQVMIGESYARMLNASWFVPACGTVAKEVVRKHLEVPACKACLITEPSPAMEAAGFSDMTNCVFADDHNVLDKLDYLFNNPAALNAIICAGYQLVHSRHTLKHRDQILQWFNLHTSLQPNQKIVQTGPFEPLRIVDKSLELANSHLRTNGLHLTLLRQGDGELWRGQYERAESAYLKCLNYYRYMPEPQFRLALCNLYKGNARMALSWIFKPIQFTLAEYKAIDPDPVEWAYLIISLLCLGKVDDAIQRSSQFPWLRHPELDRARWATNVAKNRASAAPLPEDDTPRYRFSIHQLPRRSSKEWIQDLCIMLRACRQAHLAESLTKRVSEKPLSLRDGKRATSVDKDAVANQKRGVRESRLRKRLFSVGKDGSAFFKRRQWFSTVRVTFKRPLRYALHRLEATYGHFLPYRLSESKHDEFFHAIQDLARKEDIKAALIIGAALRKGSTEALLAGARENHNRPAVFCISSSKYRSTSLPRALPKSPWVKWYTLLSSSPQNLCEELGTTLRKIKGENHIGFFDVLLIDGSQSESQQAHLTINEELARARFIVLDDINTVDNHVRYNALLTDPNYLLVEHNPGLRNGYAIFERRLQRKMQSAACLASAPMLTE